MIGNRTLACCVAGLAIAFAAADAHAQTLLGNSFNGVLYDVNLGTGAATNPRPIGVGADSLTGIAFAPSGALYGLTTFSGTPGNSLVSINPATGASTQIGFTGLPIAEGDLAFDPTSGLLYGMQDVSQNDRRLFTINLATGAGTSLGLLGASPGNDFSAMTFSPDGTLNVLSTGEGASPSRLLTVNKATAATISSVDLSLDLGFTAGMDFHPLTGTLYVADGGFNDGTDSLYTLNPATGAVTLIGPTGLADGLAGLAFVVPEPTGAAMLIAVCGAVVAMRRGRRRA
jgi:DNA-binding beta-propeller fold protein YncE